MDRVQTASRIEGYRRECQDRAEVFRRGPTLIAVVADGAGGTSGGAAAATIVVEAIRQAADDGAHHLEVENWRRVLVGTGERLESEDIGQTTAVVVATDGNLVIGASVGDSGVWLVGPDDVRDLSAGQQRKPLLGGGPVNPHMFSTRRAPREALLLAMDGILKYASADRICSAVRSPSESAADRSSALVQLVRLPDGSLQDDVGLVLGSLQDNVGLVLVSWEAEHP